MALKMIEEHSGIKHTIAIAAGKGGVGKSSVTVNLALALKRQGYSVGIFDVDVYGPSIRHMLPEEKLPRQQGDQIFPGESCGVKIISIAFFRKENEAVAVRAPIANGIITQFIRQVNWGALDFLLVDFPPGTGDVQLTLSQQAKLTGAVMVTTPQEVSLLDVRKAIHLFRQVNVPILGVVENMSYFLNPATKEREYLFGKGGGKKLAEEVGCSLLGEIPIDPEISRCADAGEPFEGEIFVNLGKKIVETRLEQRALVKRVFQRDNKTLSIEWENGEISHFTLSDVQKLCPCAGCAEKGSHVEEGVEALSTSLVGRYALKIQFTSGCSAGIYELEMLQNLVGVAS